MTHRRFRIDPAYDGVPYYEAFRRATSSLCDWLLVDDGEALDLSDEEIWSDLHLSGWTFPASIDPIDVLAAAREMAEDWLGDAP